MTSLKVLKKLFFSNAPFAFGAIFATLIASPNSFAAQSQYMHQPVLSARALGMGNAFTAVADDMYALYYNPAGLATLPVGQINFGLWGMMSTNPNVLTIGSNISGAGSDPVAMANTLSQYFGSHFASRVGLNATWAHPGGWAFGITPLDLSLEADIHGTAGVTVGVQAYEDTSFQYGIAWGFLKEKALSVGVAPKVVYRGYFEKDLTIFDLVQSSNLFRPQDAQEGLALDTDVGVLYSLATPDDVAWLKWLDYAHPTFGFAIRNLVDAGFVTNFHAFGAQSTTTQAKLERRFDFGSRFDGPGFWIFKPRLMVDLRDVGSRYASFTKCFHTGLELGWKAFGWLHGSYALGLSEGYLTAGVNLEMAVFRAELATYSEEVGSSTTSQESRRFIAKLSLDF